MEPAFDPGPVIRIPSYPQAMTLGRVDGRGEIEHLFHVPVVAGHDKISAFFLDRAPDLPQALIERVVSGTPSSRGEMHSESAGPMSVSSFLRGIGTFLRDPVTRFTAGGFGIRNPRLARQIARCVSDFKSPIPLNRRPE